MKITSILSCAAIVTGTFLVFEATSAQAATMIRSYDLFNHPYGHKKPPLYGLRLNKLFDVPDNKKDIFTFSFAPEDGANVTLDYDLDAETVHIYGTVFGGLDVKKSYDPNWSGLWNIDFTYYRAKLVDSDNHHLQVKRKRNSSGTITRLFSHDRLAETYELIARKSNSSPSYSFEFGDDSLIKTLTRETDELVGIGRLKHREYREGCKDSGVCDEWKSNKTSGWLFTATPVKTPEPASVLGLLAFGAVSLGFLSKQKKNQDT